MTSNRAITNAVKLSIDETQQLEGCEEIIENGLNIWYQVGEALLHIRDNRLYRSTHKTFEEYCQERWQMKRDYADKLIGASVVMSNLHTNGMEKLPETERHVRPLTSLARDEQHAAWNRVVESGEKPTANLVKASVQILNAPTYIAEAVDAHDIGLKQAKALIDALDSVSPAISEAATRHAITDPQLITLLETKKDTETVQSILVSGVLQTDGEETDKPLREASAWDVQGVLRKSEKEHRRAAADQRLHERHAQIQTAPDGVYSVIYADPPWSYDNSGLYGSAATIYPTMPIEAICAYLTQIDLHVQDNAVLFMWATNPLLPDALAVLSAWEFDYKTKIAWNKEKPTTGLGFSVKGQHELLMIATRGSFRPNYMPASVITDRKAEHSRKPASLYGLIETMYPNQRYIELFARGMPPRENWTFFGGEA